MHPSEFAATALAKLGLDIVQPFPAARYNRWAQTQDLSTLPLFGRADALGLVVGNTRKMWPHFLTAFAAQTELQDAADPLDLFVSNRIEESIKRIAEAYDGLEILPRFGHHTGDRLVSMLHAAEIAGLAVTGPVHLAVHPSYGPWFALRAVLVLDYPAPPPQPRPLDPCKGCDAPCQRAFDQAMSHFESKEEARRGLKPHWKDWLAVRDACPVGSDQRYENLQIRYHYSKDRAAIEEAIESRP